MHKQHWKLYHLSRRWVLCACSLMVCLCGYMCFFVYKFSSLLFSHSAGTQNRQQPPVPLICAQKSTISRKRNKKKKLPLKNVEPFTMNKKTSAAENDKKLSANPESSSLQAVEPSLNVETPLSGFGIILESASSDVSYISIHWITGFLKHWSGKTCTHVSLKCIPPLCWINKRTLGRFEWRQMLQFGLSCSCFPTFPNMKFSLEFKAPCYLSLQWKFVLHLSWSEEPPWDQESATCVNSSKTLSFID